MWCRWTSTWRKSFLWNSLVPDLISTINFWPLDWVATYWILGRYSTRIPLNFWTTPISVPIQCLIEGSRSSLQNTIEYENAKTFAIKRLMMCSSSTKDNFFLEELFQLFDFTPYISSCSDTNFSDMSNICFIVRSSGFWMDCHLSEYFSHENGWFQCWRHEHYPYHRSFLAVFCIIHWRSFFAFFRTWLFTPSKNDLDPNENSDSVSSCWVRVFNNCLWWCPDSWLASWQSTGFSVLSSLETDFPGSWYPYEVLPGFDEAEDDTNEGVLAVKFIMCRDLVVTRSSPDSCWARFAIAAMQAVELKWLILIEQGQQMIPFITCEIPLCQDVGI